MKKPGFLFLFSLLYSTVSGQNRSLFSRHWFVMNGDTMPYRLLLPADYDPSKKYPLVFFLHGRGESGRDNERQLTHGAAIFLQEATRRQHEAIVVFPQCAGNSYWSNVQTVIDDSIRGKRSFFFVEDGPPSGAMTLLMNLVSSITDRYAVNRQQVYIMGLSMGGMGTFEIVRRMPGVFAAAVAICGGAHPATAAKLVDTKWWLFHGLQDNVVDPVFTKKMEEALRNAHANVKATYYPEANHNSWDPAFREPGLLDWLFNQRLDR